MAYGIWSERVRDDWTHSLELFNFMIHWLACKNMCIFSFPSHLWLKGFCVRETTSRTFNVFSDVFSDIISQVFSSNRRQAEKEERRRFTLKFSDEKKRQRCFAVKSKKAMWEMCEIIAFKGRAVARVQEEKDASRRRVDVTRKIVRSS